MTSLNVLIAVPAYGGFIRRECTQSLMKIPAAFIESKISMSCRFLDYADIATVRNFYASLAVQDSFSHLLFVDSDMAFEPASILALLSKGKDVIGCIYSKRTLNSGAVVHSSGPVTIKNNLAKVDGVGMGLCLISTNSLRQLRDTGNIAEISGHPFSLMGLTGPLLDFFGTHTTDGKMISEDLAFCRRWRTLCNGEVWALYGEKIGHVGSHVFRI